MRKDYQNGEIDTSQPAVPETVSVGERTDILGGLIHEYRRSTNTAGRPAPVPALRFDARSRGCCIPGRCPDAW